MVENKTYRAFKIIGLFELAQLKLKNESELKLENYYNVVWSGKGKNAIEIPLVHILKPGTKCIFYKDSIEELKDLDINDLLLRVFRVYKFNVVGVTKYIYLQNHLEARKNDELLNGDDSFDLNKYQGRLKLNPEKFNCAIENKDFNVTLDGKIRWLY
jgi:hypothetical protein